MRSPWIKLQQAAHQYQREEMVRITRLVRGLGVAVIVALGLIITSVVLAAPASQPVTPAANVQQWWMPLLAPVIAALGTMLAAFVTALLSKLIKVLEAKYKVDVPVMIEQLLTDKAKQLVAAVEEAAENRLLHGDGQPTPGAEKSKQVVTALLAFADSLGYGKVYQEEQAKRLADAALHLARVGSDTVVGSNGERGKLLAKAAHRDASGR